MLYSGIYYETCAICLEDYVEGEKIRILPCNHGKSDYNHLAQIKVVTVVSKLIT